ncbi:efflux RND transporter periplasmic adaptor subunit [Peptostreptococcus faecalis]|uniref:efflux RND transporter periplasmic adaptor subunit n=1 Tax=Peptostreptococcus faecalis TaxID=2045015 RepID=UPI000C7B1097|nr:efflux RND transporter periplasmic adaptor subunit [Peptostreptococcus faecalis]
MSFKNKFQEGLSKLKSNRKIQIYVGVVAVIAIVAVGGIVIYNNSKDEPEYIMQTYTVPEYDKVFINGTVVPKQSKDIAGPLNGVTPDIRVSNGQNVKKDDVLYIIKDEAAVNEASSIKTQISNLIREKRSLKSDDPTLTSINNQIATLNTSLSTANSKAYTRVKSPIDGKVYINDDKEGNVQSSGGSSALMTVQSSEYVMNGELSEQDVSKIKTDMTADVTILPTGDTIKARVNYIAQRPIVSSSQATPTQNTSANSSLSFYNVVLFFDTQEGIVDGYHTQAVINVNTDKNKVPTKAIVNSGDEIYVFVDVDGVLKKVNVEILSESGDISVVSGDLNPKDIVVKNPTKTMRDGDTVPGKSTKESKDEKNSSKDV